MNIIGIEPSAMPALEYKVSEGRLLNADDKLQIVFGFNMKDQFYNPKSRNRYGRMSYNEDKDFNFLEDKILMTLI